MPSACTASALPTAEVGRNAITTSELLELTTEANPLNARQLRVCFREWLRRLGAPAALVDDLTLAVYEALANVVEHAYHPGQPHPVMHLQARLDHEQLLITVTDHGRWRTHQERGHRGRGLTMMRSLTTEVHLHRTAQGTTVQLCAAFPPQQRRSRPNRCWAGPPGVGQQRVQIRTRVEPQMDAASEETGHVTGMKDKDYNMIWFVEQCLSNALRLETYIQDAERDGDVELADFFRRAQGESRKGAMQGKEHLRKRLAS